MELVNLLCSKLAACVFLQQTFQLANVVNSSMLSTHMTSFQLRNNKIISNQMMTEWQWNNKLLLNHREAMMRAKREYCYKHQEVWVQEEFQRTSLEGGYWLLIHKNKIDIIQVRSCKPQIRKEETTNLLIEMTLPYPWLQSYLQIWWCHNHKE